MLASKRLFREEALERLSSPEQLDQQLQVTSARGWIALTAIWALLAAIILWSFLGEVHTKEEGQGILVTRQGLSLVVAEGAGKLSKILVEVDDVIEGGDVVAHIDKRDLVVERDELRLQLDELEAQHAQHNDFDRAEEGEQTDLAEKETQRLEQIIEFSGQRLERLDRRRRTVQDLVDQGSMTDIDVDKVDEEIEEARLDREKARLEIEQLVARNREAHFRRERERLKRVFQISELEGRIKVLDSRLQHESMVVSDVAGKVVELRAAEQTTIEKGDHILLLDLEPEGSESGKLEAILYVSAATGKRINEGDKVHISPSTVKREEHGSMEGTVSFIAETPTGQLAMMAVLNDEQMVERFTQQFGLPLMTRVDLIADRNTPSGYKWTSADGPPGEISAGTLCTGTVTVETQRPIELVIPMIKKKLGMD
jgi:HlyD family secretion protein